MADEDYDAIVIGTSQGGRFLPIELATAGQKVALVERGQLGGVCVNTGCTPTKTMVASARLAYGMTEREARAQGRAIRVAKLPMSAVVRAIETGETRGFMKAIVDADTGQILGCAVLGSEGGEIMTMIQVAMLGKLTHTAMADAIFTHPLLARPQHPLRDVRRLSRDVSNGSRQRRRAFTAARCRSYRCDPQGPNLVRLHCR
jgi:pyruvate/2-oxoglutarate dehydrogenase complex dihydrolipoamide dehydrogenase (E3) component